MKNILLAASSEKNLDALSSMISSVADVISKINVVTATRAAEVREVFRTSDIDLTVINTPLSDEQGVELSLYIADTLMNEVIVITNEETYTRAGEQLMKHGIIVIRRPVERKALMYAISNSLVISNRVKLLREKNRELQESIEEGKLVNRAKAMLISNLNMTEAQAHRYIEKQAMDMRLSKRIIAQNILKTYYNK